MAFISFALRISINSFWAFDILVQHSNNNNNNNNYNNFFLLSIPSMSHGKQWVIVGITTRSSIGKTRQMDVKFVVEVATYLGVFFQLQIHGIIMGVFYKFSENILVNFGIM